MMAAWSCGIVDPVHQRGEIAVCFLIQHAVRAEVAEGRVGQAQLCWMLFGGRRASATLVPSSTSTMPKKPTGLFPCDRVVGVADHDFGRDGPCGRAAARASTPQLARSSRIHCSWPSSSSMYSATRLAQPLEALGQARAQALSKGTVCRTWW